MNITDILILCALAWSSGAAGGAAAVLLLGCCRAAARELPSINDVAACDERAFQRAASVPLANHQTFDSGARPETAGHPQPPADGASGNTARINRDTGVIPSPNNQEPKPKTEL